MLLGNALKNRRGKQYVAWYLRNLRKIYQDKYIGIRPRGHGKLNDDFTYNRAGLLGRLEKYLINIDFCWSGWNE